MLIIAMPKSASSSLARTIARANGLDERNDDINAQHPPQFSDRHLLAQEFHPFPAVPVDDLRRIVRDRAALRKLHLFPTREVLDATHDERVIVITREPREIVEAEFRAYIAGIHPRVGSMPLTLSLRSWWAAAESGGLRESLEALRSSWLEVARNRSDILLLTHREIVAAPREALIACSRHLGLDTAPSELLQERWSRAAAGAGRAERTSDHPFGFVTRTLLRRAARGTIRRVAAAGTWLATRWAGGRSPARSQAVDTRRGST